LKTYINYYKKNIVLPGDNPLVALLLVTENDPALVEYAVADSDMQLFVSKYMLELPSTQQLADFIRKELDGLIKLCRLKWFQGKERNKNYCPGCEALGGIVASHTFTAYRCGAFLGTYNSFGQNHEFGAVLFY